MAEGKYTSLSFPRQRRRKEIDYRLVIIDYLWKSPNLLPFEERQEIVAEGEVLSS
jgi:hypothetical protein